MTKIIINKCHGGFGLSDKAIVRYNEMGGKDMSPYRWAIYRDDPELVQVVEELGDEANGIHAKLAVVEIPDGVEWQIEEYDGMEWIAEKHRTWS